MPAEDPWPAPVADGPVRATVAVPGSKSQTNRALVLAALADGPSTITGGLKARDTKLMAAGLRAMGTQVSLEGRAWHVEPGELRGPAHVDCGLAGTVMRFLPVVAGLAGGDIRFDGDPRARMRPMGAMLTALEALGVQVADDGRNCLPFTVQGTGQVLGGAAQLDASASSQFVSGILLGAARFDRGVQLHHVGQPIPSLPHVEMTVAMLRESGVEVSSTTQDPRDAHWEVAPGPIRAVDRAIEPDLSNAAPFLAAAMVTGGQVTIPGWPARTTQAGAHLVEILGQMGAVSELTDDGLRLRGPEQISGIDINLRDVGELTPVVAAIAALAASPSRLRGIGQGQRSVAAGCLSDSGQVSHAPVGRLDEAEGDHVGVRLDGLGQVLQRHASHHEAEVGATEEGEDDRGELTLRHEHARAGSQHGRRECHQRRDLCAHCHLFRRYAYQPCEGFARRCHVAVVAGRRGCTRLPLGQRSRHLVHGDLRWQAEAGRVQIATRLGELCPDLLLDHTSIVAADNRHVGHRMDRATSGPLQTTGERQGWDFPDRSSRDPPEAVRSTEPSATIGA